MKVAIITRTKDRPIFLKRAIQSVASQSFKEYIHVIVNDGGSKEGIETVLGAIPEDQVAKVKVFHRDIPSNAPDTIFNESIDRVESEYFAIHDDDDTWHPDFLKETIQHLDTHTTTAAVVVRTEKITEQVRGNLITLRKKQTWMPDLKVINLYRQCIDNQFTPISTLFRRESYEAVGKFDDTLPVVGDWEFGIRLLQKYDADFIDPGYALSFYHHRIQKDNSFATHNHRYYVNKVMNSYLREELRDGRLGVGYIMSKLKYEQAFIFGLAKRILPKTLQRVIKSKSL